MKAATESKAFSVSNTSNLVLHLLFVLYSLACIIPLLLVVSISFSDETKILENGYKLIPEKFSLKAYDYLFNDFSQIVHSYGISIFVTVIGTILSLALTAFYAYPLSRRDLPYKNFFAFYIFFVMLFNGGLVPFYLVYVNFLGLKDTVWALILPLLLSPFFVLVMRTFFSTTIPVSILESARIDGAGEFKIFTKIVLPLSLPVLATIALFSTLNYWNDWFLSMIFISDNKTISVQYLMYKTLLNIQYLTTNSNASSQISSQGGIIEMPNKTLQMAMAVIGIGPIIFAYPFFQKYFIKGLTVGAVKG